MLLSVVPLHLPIAIPNFLFFQVHSGNSWTGAIQPLGVIEALAIDITQGEMRKVEVANIPIALRLAITIHLLAKEGQLEAKAMPVGGLEIAGVVPPLGFVIGMIKVVARELVAITRQRLLVLGKQRRGANQEQ